ncbi:hypothetical protein DMC63_15425 [Streptomyces sp. WAC 05977]|nr:hypothetical protein DMC63_15425 [Streptomyces sp. WAC 05977]
MWNRCRGSHFRDVRRLESGFRDLITRPGHGRGCESHFRNVEGCESGFRNLRPSPPGGTERLGFS